MSNYQPITDRTLELAIRVVKLCQELDKHPGVAKTISKQLLRSGTSIGANVDESQAAESTADFVHKLKIALKEGRETRYWLKLLMATDIIPEAKLLPIYGELNEVIKIIGAIIVKTQKNHQK
ncbi:four helix bundle protein [Anabaena sp. PCC 7108]|uniref:four helix bundle protein n=1 Tax=Anabaena sp. PCC 7108 TaxID=163908 RepID=UPI00034A8236|nr:four helix bundle protein [Anabaena sp. PCC 7108]